MGCEYTRMQNMTCQEIIELPSRTSSISNAKTYNNNHSVNNSKSNSNSNKKSVNRSKARTCRRNIYSSDDIGEENIVPVANYTLMKTDYEFLKKILRGHFIFSELDHNEIMRLIQNMEVYKIDKDTAVFNQGDQGHRLFVIKSGVIQIQTKFKKTQKLTAGQCFGQLALIYRAPRSATARALKASQFYCISQRIFQKTMQQVMIRNFGFIKSHIVQASIFKFLTMKQKIMITHKAQILNYNQGDYIYKLKDQASAMYIIAKGVVNIIKADQNKIILASQQFFGDSCLENGNLIRQESVIAGTDSTIISISLKDLHKCVKQKMFRLSFYSIIRRAFTENDYLSKLPSKTLQKVLSLAQIKYFANNCQIQSSTAPHRQFYICLQGAINNKKVGSVHNLDQLIQPISINNIMEIIKNQGGYVAVFSIDAIQQYVGEKAINTLKEYRSQKSINISVSINQINYDDIKDNGLNQIRDIQIADLNLLCERKSKNTEESSYKRTICVEDSKNKNQYMLICFKNDHKNKDIAKAIKYQKSILNLISSPFAPVLHKYESTAISSLFLTSSMGSQTLSQILTQKVNQNSMQISSISHNQNAGLTQQQIQFTMACLVCLLQTAHNKNIVLRNINPDYLIINEKKGQSQGYLSFADFTQSKILQQSSGYRTFTVVGSPHHMAPQMIAGRGYSFAVDLWALGVVLYEMISGVLPFGDDSDDPYHIFEDVYLSTGFPVPSRYVQPCCLSLLSILLNKDQSERNVQNYKQLQSMEYFQGVNWLKLNNYQTKSPLICYVNSRVPSTQKCILNKDVKTYLAEFLNQVNKEANK